MKKNSNKLISIILVFVMLCSLMPTFTVKAAAASGNWTDSGNYNTTVAAQSAQSFTITTEEQLAGFALSVNGGKTYSNCIITLGANIDMGAHYWTPIGTSTNYFAGTFNGAGHTISNLTYTAISGCDSYGLFGYTNGATIQNLKFTVNMSLPSLAGGATDYVYCGGLVGSATSSNIYECEFTSATAFTISATKQLVTGGIVGYSSGSRIISCAVKAVISSNGVSASNYVYVGGVAGNLQSSMVINCSANGTSSSGTTASSDFIIGGIAAYSTGSTISSCQTLASIAIAGATITTLYAGGILGYGLSSSAIRNCNVSSSAVSIAGTISTGYYGGIAASFTNSTMIACYAVASLSASLGSMAAIIANGTSSTVSNICYALGGNCTSSLGSSTSSFAVYDMITVDSGSYLSVLLPSGVSLTGRNASDILNGGDTNTSVAANTQSITYPVTWAGTTSPSLSDWVVFGNYDSSIALADPGNITVSTAAQLAGVAAAIRLYGKDYTPYKITLGADINLSTYPWIGIPVGVFDGANYTISGLNVNSGFQNYGLFSTATEVKNLTVLGNVNVSPNLARETNVGGIVGRATNMTSCATNITITYTDNMITTDSTKLSRVGGLVGALYANGTLLKCSTSGSITVNARNYSLLGGLTAYLNTGTLTKCDAQNSITFSNTSASFGSRAGGLVAVAEGAANILNSRSGGSLTVTGASTEVWSAGGFLANGVSGTISNCYTTVNVTGSAKAGHVGGFIGASDGAMAYKNCFSSGSLTPSNSNYGMFFGLISYPATITNCYWLQNANFSTFTKWVGSNNAASTVNSITMLTAAQLANDEVIPSGTTVGTTTYVNSKIVDALNSVAATISNADTWFDEGANPRTTISRPTVTVNLDGAASSVPITTNLALYNGTTLVVAMTGSFGTYTANIADGTYNVYANGSDTGVDITVTNGAGTATVNFNTVTFKGTIAGTATNANVTATYDGVAITSPKAVVSGKTLVLTATGIGAGSYTYSWSGAGTSSQTTRSITISSLSSAVDATCAVTGANGATVNVKLDGAASASPLGADTLSLYSGTTKTADMTGSAGVYTANVVNGIYNVYLGTNDTGVDVTVASGIGTATLDYYTVTFNGTVAGTATGANVTATYDGATITSPKVVPAGKTLVLTATGLGANSYTYLWSGTGTSSQTTQAITISSLSAAVNATCAVTGTSTSSGGTSSSGTSNSGSLSKPSELVDMIKGSNTTIIAKMETGSTTVTYDVLSALAQNSGRTLILEANTYKWEIPAVDSASLKSGTSYDMGTTIDKTLTGVGNVSGINSGNIALKIAINHDGELPGTFTLKFNADTAYSSKTLYLYMLNKSTGKYVYQCKTVVGSAGAVALAFTHASEYILTDKMILTDIEGHWANSYILSMVDLGVVSDNTQGLFEPDKSATRAEFSKMVAVAFGYTATKTLSEFSDVKQSDWYYTYVAALYEKGIIKGVGNGSFGADDTLSREQMATIIYRVLADKGYTIANTKTSVSFSDASKISDYAKEAVNSLALKQIVNGITETEFSPQASASKAQVATIIYRILNAVKKA